MNLYAPTPTAAEYDAAQEVNASYFNPDADPSKGGERTPARAFQAGWLEGAPEPRVPIRIATAQPSRDGDLLDDLGEDAPTLLVLGALAMLDRRPFVVAAHGVVPFSIPGLVSCRGRVKTYSGP